MKKFLYQMILKSLVVVFFVTSFVPNSFVFAQNPFLFNTPNATSVITQNPSGSLLGLKIYPDSPLRFDFILHQTSDSHLSTKSIEKESLLGVEYFLASLTTPEQDLWVNLSPYEKDRIAAESFTKTAMGRDLLEQDHTLKQITASLINPQEPIGKSFWNQLYQKVQQEFGTTDVPIDVFHKVWIVPDRAVVYEDTQTQAIYIVESKLKVMLEADYLAQSKNALSEQVGRIEKSTDGIKDGQIIAQDTLQEIIIPLLEKEINEGESFQVLRRIYNSLILATWYKNHIKESLLSKVYVDQSKITGIEIDDAQEAEKIWAQYVQTFQKGVFHHIAEERDHFTGEMIPRQYFSGGMQIVPKLDKTFDSSALTKAIDSASQSLQVLQIAVQVPQEQAFEKKDDVPALGNQSFIQRAEKRLKTFSDYQKAVFWQVIDFTGQAWAEEHEGILLGIAPHIWFHLGEIIEIQKQRNNFDVMENIQSLLEFISLVGIDWWDQNFQKISELYYSDWGYLNSLVLALGQEKFQFLFEVFLEHKKFSFALEQAGVFKIFPGNIQQADELMGILIHNPTYSRLIVSMVNIFEQDLSRLWPKVKKILSQNIRLILLRSSLGALEGFKNEFQMHKEGLSVFQGFHDVFLDLTYGVLLDNEEIESLLENYLEFFNFSADRGFYSSNRVLTQKYFQDLFQWVIAQDINLGWYLSVAQHVHDHQYLLLLRKFSDDSIFQENKNLLLQSPSSGEKYFMSFLQMTLDDFVKQDLLKQKEMVVEFWSRYKRCVAMTEGLSWEQKQAVENFLQSTQLDITSLKGEKLITSLIAFVKNVSNRQILNDWIDILVKLYRQGMNIEKLFTELDVSAFQNLVMNKSLQQMVHAKSEIISIEFLIKLLSSSDFVQKYFIRFGSFHEIDTHRAMMLIEALNDFNEKRDKRVDEYHILQLAHFYFNNFGLIDFTDQVWRLSQLAFGLKILDELHVTLHYFFQGKTSHLGFLEKFIELGTQWNQEQSINFYAFLNDIFMNIQPWGKIEPKLFEFVLQKEVLLKLLPYQMDSKKMASFVLGEYLQFHPHLIQYILRFPEQIETLSRNPDFIEHLNWFSAKLNKEQTPHSAMLRLNNEAKDTLFAMIMRPDFDFERAKDIFEKFFYVSPHHLSFSLSQVASFLVMDQMSILNLDEFRYLIEVLLDQPQKSLEDIRNIFYKRLLGNYQRLLGDKLLSLEDSNALEDSMERQMKKFDYEISNLYALDHKNNLLIQVSKYFSSSQEFASFLVQLESANTVKEIKKLLPKQSQMSFKEAFELKLFSLEKVESREKFVIRVLQNLLENLTDQQWGADRYEDMFELLSTYSYVSRERIRENLTNAFSKDKKLRSLFQELPQEYAIQTDLRGETSRVNIPHIFLKPLLELNLSDKNYEMFRFFIEILYQHSNLSALMMNRIYLEVARFSQMSLEAKKNDFLRQINFTNIFRDILQIVIPIQSLRFTPQEIEKIEQTLRMYLGLVQDIVSFLELSKDDILEMSVKDYQTTLLQAQEILLSLSSEEIPDTESIIHFRQQHKQYLLKKFFRLIEDYNINISQEDHQVLSTYWQKGNFLVDHEGRNILELLNYFLSRDDLNGLAVEVMYDSFLAEVKGEFVAYKFSSPDYIRFLDQLVLLKSDLLSEQERRDFFGDSTEGKGLYNKLQEATGENFQKLKDEIESFRSVWESEWGTLQENGLTLKMVHSFWELVNIGNYPGSRSCQNIMDPRVLNEYLAGYVANGTVKAATFVNESGQITPARRIVKLLFANIKNQRRPIIFVEENMEYGSEAEGLKKLYEMLKDISNKTGFPLVTSLGSNMSAELTSFLGYTESVLLEAVEGGRYLPYSDAGIGKGRFFLLVKYPESDTVSDAAETSSDRLGGIDLRSQQWNIETRSDTRTVHLTFSADVIEEFAHATGLEPQILGIHPLQDISSFFQIK